MLRYFEYFLNREPVALDEASLPRSVLEGLPEHLPLADWLQPRDMGLPV
jgi:hypothetical protein